MGNVGAAHVGWTERWFTGDIGGFGSVNEKKEENVCERDDYFAMTAQELSTSTIGALIPSKKGSFPEYEASAIVHRPQSDEYWVISDNLWELIRLNSDLVWNEENGFLSPTSSSMADHGGDSQLEGIALDLEDEDRFYLLAEAEMFGDDLFPVIRRAMVRSPTTYELETKCIVDFKLESDGKGLEGLNLIRIDDEPLWQPDERM